MPPVLKTERQGMEESHKKLLDIMFGMQLASKVH